MIGDIPLEKWRSAFRQMLTEVEEETDRDGAVAVEDVLKEMDRTIADSRQ
jgi:hypothetical protein